MARIILTLYGGTTSTVTRSKCSSQTGQISNLLRVRVFAFDNGITLAVLKSNVAVPFRNTVRITGNNFNILVKFEQLLRCNFERSSTPISTGFTAVLSKHFKISLALKNISLSYCNVRSRDIWRVFFGRSYGWDAEIKYDFRALLFCNADLHF